MGSKSISNNIIQSDSGIIIQETSITLTDEKLQGILLHTYERAISDNGKWHFYKLYGTFLSIAGTLLITILTSTFNGFGAIDSSKIQIFSIILMIIFGLLGFICLGISVNQKKKNDTEERDTAISEIFEKYASK